MCFVKLHLLPHCAVHHTPKRVRVTHISNNMQKHNIHSCSTEKLIMKMTSSGGVLIFEGYPLFRYSLGLVQNGVMISCSEQIGLEKGVSLS